MKEVKLCYDSIYSSAPAYRRGLLLTRRGELTEVEISQVLT